jgi:hypothetical protein
VAGSHAPSAEACAFIGSLVNVAAFLIWQLAYTVPRWDALVVAPIADAPQPIPKPSVRTLTLEPSPSPEGEPAPSPSNPRPRTLALTRMLTPTLP